MDKDYLHLGYVKGTHGIKGEIKIKSLFSQKNKVFIVGNSLYIDKNYEKLIIDSYRTHKDCDLVLLKGYSNINEVLKFVGKEVYVIREELNLEENSYIDNDLVNMEVIDQNKNLIGKVTSLLYLTKNKRILVINNNKYLPFEKEFVKDIDLENKKVYISSIEGMF